MKQKKIESWSDANIPVDNVLPMIVVTFNTSDFPEKFVARLHLIRAGKHETTPYHMVRDSLEEIRDEIPFSFNNMGRHKNDDPVIVEVWV